MSAILFGSISTLADTSEMQRASFNEAFTQHGLDWVWDRDHYLEMLGSNGGADRIAAYAEARGETVDAAAVHASKSEIFQHKLGTGTIEARPGVVETIRGAKDAGIKLGFVTTTSAANVAALLDALAPGITRADFDLVVDVSEVSKPKPDPAAYLYALTQLNEDASSCVAIEDNAGGSAAAIAAGLRCVAFPNANTGLQDFGGEAGATNRIELADLRQLIPAA